MSHIRELSPLVMETTSLVTNVTSASSFLLIQGTLTQVKNLFMSTSGKESEGMSRVLGTKETEYEQLSKENLSTILSYGDSLMETVCRDACDGHDIGRVRNLTTKL